MISYKEILYVTPVSEIEKDTPVGTIAITIIANQLQVIRGFREKSRLISH